MKNPEVIKILKSKFDAVSYNKKTNAYTVKDSYYWGVSKGAEAKIEKVKSLFPTAEILSSGNHYHAFVGGAKSGSAKDSYFWVVFKLS